MSPPSDQVSSATPLVSLSAVVLDTETTGLDTKRARIIQIGAVRIVNGRVHDSEPFDRLIDPGEPISSASTKIHRITDEHVRGAGDFGAVNMEFDDWCNDALILGYSIGFDLAMFKSEHGRAGLQWRPPRCLDVRHLVQILAPPLPDEALETAADWLGISVTDRHQALADARLTAEIFLRLVPRLREKGIWTLAEAESACRQLSQQISKEVQSGWQEVVRSGEITSKSVAALARIDSYPYRHRVRDIMNSPPFVIGPDLSIRRVLGVMMREQISSVFVEPTEAGGPTGIITERDVLRAIDADPDGALDRPADKFAVRPLKTVRQDQYVYRAIGRMNSERLRHLAVLDDRGDLVGAVSARDLLRQRAGDAMSLGDEIEQAGTPEDLGAIWTKLTVVAQGLTYEEVDPRDVASIVSNELRCLTKQACVIAESEMAAAGEGGPPVPYAMMVLGSGGRGESLLAMDQDNAIVFESGAPGGEEDKWFEALGTRVADILDAIGVAYCKGGIMASNASWRMSADDWRTTIAGWIDRSRPEDILNTDIFFDSAPVHGAWHLADTIRAEAQEIAAGSNSFLKLLAHHAADINVPIGWFGKFRLVDGRVDLKKGGIMPIFSAARVLALKFKLEERTTPERLAMAKTFMKEDAGAIDGIIDAHRILLGEILEQQLRDLQEGVPLSNSVNPKQLSASRLDSLKWAVEQVGSVPGLLGDPVILA